MKQVRRPVTARKRRSPLPLRKISVWSLALILLIGVLAYDLWTSRKADLARAEEGLVADLAVGSRYVFERVASLKSKLETLDHQLPDSGALFAKRQAHSLLKKLAGEDRSLVSMFILDPAGRAWATFREPNVEAVDLSDREYFRGPVQGGGAGIYISSPQVGRLGPAKNREFVGVSAPWYDDQGGLQGVLVGLLDYTAITELVVGGIDDGSTQISVFTDDGRRVFGNLDHGISTGQLASCGNPAEGYDVRTETLADRAHLFVCQTITPLGLIGVATRPVDAALSSWRADSVQKGVMGLIIVAILLGAFVLLRVSAGRTRQTVERAELLSAALEQTSGAIAITDDRLRLVWINEGACWLTGYDRSNLVGHPARRLLQHTASWPFFVAMWRTIRRGAAWSGALSVRRRDGSVTAVHLGITPLFDQMGLLTNIVAIQDQNASLEAHLRDYETRIRTDDLTGLLNRPGLVAAYASAHSMSDKAWIAVVDIERFRTLNLYLGRAAADNLLREMASLLRAHDDVAGAGRIVSDRFAIWGSTSSDDADAIEATILRIHRYLEYQLERRAQRRVRLTIGYLAGPELTGDAEEDLSRAEAAIAAARSQRGSYVARYSSDLVRETLDRERLTDDLGTAIANHQFRFVLQPQVSLTDHKTIGAELLMRWTHPVFGSVPPDVFIPLAEHNGMIAELGQLAAEQAASTLVDWKAQGFADLRISFNASVVELENSEFADDLARLMRRRDVSPGDVVVEVTESAASMASDVVRHQLEQLLDYGFGVEIDDFGTGYATLSQLRALPHSGLKIDREFTSSLADGQTERIVQSVLLLAQDLGWAVVAEGIENGDQAAWLAENGCQYGQGYYFGKPMPASDFLDRVSFEADPGTGSEQLSPRPN